MNRLEGLAGVAAHLWGGGRALAKAGPLLPARMAAWSRQNRLGRHDHTGKHAGWMKHSWTDTELVGHDHQGGEPRGKPIQAGWIPGFFAITPQHP